MSNAEERAAARVHWVVVGPFGTQEKSFDITRDNFPDAMEKASLVIEAEVPDRIGGSGNRTFKVGAPALKALTSRNIIKSVPELGELLALGETLAGRDAPTGDALQALLKQKIGEGQLYNELMAIVSPPAEAPGGGADAAGQAPANAEQIFEKAEVQQKSAKSAVDMFLSAARPKKAAPAVGKQLRGHIEQVVYGLAKEVLSSPQVAEVEGAWRGLSLFLSHCPPKAKMFVEVFDTPPEGAVQVLRDRPRGDEVDEPDAVFLPFEVSDADTLKELALIAEEQLSPIVVGLAPAALGASSFQALPDYLGELEEKHEEAPEAYAPWLELRQDESSRWLCAVANRAVLYAEGAGDARREAFGSGVWAIAAMLASSYAAQGSFSRITGRAGSLKLPGTWIIPSGPHADTSTPTEAFYTIKAVDTLANHGILGLGSGRNSDMVTLSRTPTVHAGQGLVPLAAQILTGRIVRFAWWVKAQVEPGSTDEQVRELFAEAAKVLLFPGMENVAQVAAGLQEENGAKKFVVYAKVNPAHAGVPLELGFGLPMD